MMIAGHWNPNHWNANYWNVNYWSEFVESTAIAGQNININVVDKNIDILVESKNININVVDKNIELKV